MSRHSDTIDELVLLIYCFALRICRHHSLELGASSVGIERFIENETPMILTGESKSIDKAPQHLDLRWNDDIMTSFYPVQDVVVHLSRVSSKWPTKEYSLHRWLTDRHATVVR